MPDDIEHLDLEMDPLARLDMSVRDVLDPEDIDQAVLVVREQGGGQRVLFLGHPDHAVVMLQRATKMMERVGS